MKIELIGCGGTTHHLITPLIQLLVLHGEHRLRLWDGDTFEERNTSRQFLALGQIGNYKAECMRDYALAVAPLAKVIAKKEYFYYDLAKRVYSGDKSIVICLADNSKAVVEAKKLIDKHGGLLIRAGSNGPQGEGWVYYNGIPNSPFDRYPDILTDTSGDPRSPESCQSEVQLTENPQTPHENFMSATCTMHLFYNWCIRPCVDANNNIGQVNWVKNKITTQTIRELCQQP